MTREMPKNTPPPLSGKEKEGWVRQIRKYKVITPLYGGGEETQQADSLTTVRASEVRGHLRFWWRATRGGAYHGSLREMREAEERIWGSSGEEKKPGPSEVSILLIEDEAGTVDRPFEVVANRNNRPQIRPRHGSLVHPYAAFPLQPEQREARIGMETKGVRVGVAFSIILTYPRKNEEDVKAALWAWETFGGIGARTRRGFGALQCIAIDDKSETPPSRNSISRQFYEELQKQVSQDNVWPAGVPHILADPKKNKLISRGTKPVEAWYDLIDALKSFRQWRRKPRNQNQPGRSYWPEPEEIRARTGQRLPEHQPLANNIHKFPRAQFGLPIIFHFKDTNRHNPNDPSSDPHDTTVQGKNHDRLASPLILKPIACSDGAIGLAAILGWTPLETDENYTPPGGLILEGAPSDASEVESDIKESEVKSIPPLGGNTDVLQAFLDSLK